MAVLESIQTDMSEPQRVFSQVALFGNLNDEELVAVAALATMKFFHKNTIIISDGDESDSLYVISQGRVKVFLSDSEGKEVVLNIQGPGEYFGELSLIDQAPRSASVMTLEDSQFLVISRQDFEILLDRHPRIARQLMKGLTRRLRSLTDNVRNLALMDVYGRVAQLLLTLAAEQGGDGRLIENRPTHKEIAARVGASREMVGRILKDLVSGGYIEIDKKAIRILERLPEHW